MIKDLTCVYYTANKALPSFMASTQEQLLKSIGLTPIISISQKPIDLGTNICVGNIGSSTLNIYRQSLIGAKAATTKYIAMVEDDILYTPSHFEHIPTPGVFAYNKNIWGIYTWTEPLFSYKGRRNLSTLICERELYIKVMEERFAKYPDEKTAPLHLWGEPTKYESQLGVTVNKAEFYYSKDPTIMFSHPEALGYQGLGKRKKLGLKPTPVLKYWGKASEVLSIYK
jgi:hypothetical protein